MEPKRSLRLDQQLESICRSLAAHDYAYLPASCVQRLVSTAASEPMTEWESFAASWDSLPLDEYMADGGTYRRRRHATLGASTRGESWHIESHQPHYQPTYYNALNGGIARHFAPIESNIIQGAVFTSIMRVTARICGRLAPYADWHIEAHQFRIIAQPQEKAYPTPEGTHRDGVDYAFMTLIQRCNVNGGVTNLYREGDPQHAIAEFELASPLETAVVDDQRLRHEVSPIQARVKDCMGFRDVLVITFKHKLH